jgi:hypothetical protein
MYKQDITIGDGFKFGCGLWLSAVVASIIISVIGAIFTVLATVLGMGAMLPFLQNLPR